MPSHLALTIHEIVAHATEIDRIVGYEANYAGTSFVKISDLGKLKYGSKHFNVTADRTFPPDGDRRLRRRRRQGAEMAAGQGGHTGRPADQPRDGAPGRREGKPRLHLREPLAQLSVPANAERPARARPEGIADGRSDDRRREGRRARRRRGKLQHRPAALQRPVRRRRVLGDQERQEDAHGDRLHLQRDHHGLLGQPRRRGPARDLGAPRPDRRCQGPAGAVEPSITRLRAVPHSQDHGRGGVRQAADQT